MTTRLKPLFPYLARYKAQFAWSAVYVLVSNITYSLLPLAIGRATDDILRGTTARHLETFAAIIITIALVRGIFLYLTRWTLIGISREIEFDLRNDLFRTLETQSPDFYQKNRTGDIMARMTNDLNAVRMLLGPAIMYTANTIVFSAAALYFMIRMSPLLTLLVFLPLVLCSAFIQKFGRAIHQRFERIQAMFSEISARAQENFSGARLVRAFAQEDFEAERFEEANREYIRRGLRLARIASMLWPVLEFLLGISLVILLGSSGWILAHWPRDRSVGIFTAFSTYIFQLMMPVIALGYVINLFQRGTASVVRIHELLVAKPTVDNAAADASLAGARLDGDIQFRNLSFRYGDREILRNVSLHVPAGSSLAIVGPTGSGKTTLVSLIPRLQDVSPGSLLLDGRPVREYPLETLRQNIGFVPQETYLFSETIAENIRFGSSKANDTEVQQAAASAHIAEDIREFPRGFETIVGERGLTLSGGQKQRTAIARALVREPRILVLDDALASVDTQTEERILEDLRRRMIGRTTLFISHRVSTARHADMVAVLVDGRIAEHGTHEELLTRGGYYTELYQKQLLEEELAVVS